VPTLNQSPLDFIARANGARSSLMGDYLLKADDELQVSDFFTTTFGDKVFDSLQSKRVLFNLLRHEEYGSTIGWRIRSARNGSTQSIAELDNLPDIGSQTYQGVSSIPRQIVSMIGVSELAQWISAKEGGMGDALARELEFAEIDHLKEINAQSLLSSVDICSTAGASATAALGHPAAWRVGDEFWANSNSSEGCKITAINSTTGVISFTQPDGTAASSLVDGEAITAKGRQGITSLDDIIEADGRTLAGASNQDVDVYDQTTRTADTYNASQVLDNDGTARDFDTDQLDDLFVNIREAGGEPDLIVSNYRQHKRAKQQMAAQRRYMEVEFFTVKRGGEENIPGQATGFQVASYDNVGWFQDPDVQGGISSTDVLHGGNVYLLDTRWLAYGVAYTTEYFEQRDPIIVDKLAVVGMFRTTLELKCYDFRKQGKIVDLSV